MMSYEEEGETLKDKSRCADLRANLKMCLLETDCCRVQKRTPRDCLQSKDPSVPEECYISMEGEDSEDLEGLKSLFLVKDNYNKEREGNQDD